MPLDWPFYWKGKCKFEKCWECYYCAVFRITYVFGRWWWWRRRLPGYVWRSIKIQCNIFVLVHSVLVFLHIILTINFYQHIALGAILSIFLFQVSIFKMIECVKTTPKLTTTQLYRAICYIWEFPLNGLLLITIFQCNYVIDIVNFLNNTAAP